MVILYIIIFFVVVVGFVFLADYGERQVTSWVSENFSNLLSSIVSVVYWIMVLLLAAILFKILIS